MDGEDADQVDAEWVGQACDAICIAFSCTEWSQWAALREEEGEEQERMYVAAINGIEWETYPMIIAMQGHVQSLISEHFSMCGGIPLLFSKDGNWIACNGSIGQI